VISVWSLVFPCQTKLKGTDGLYFVSLRVKVSALRQVRMLAGVIVSHIDQEILAYLRKPDETLPIMLNTFRINWPLCVAMNSFINSTKTSSEKLWHS